MLTVATVFYRDADHTDCVCYYLTHHSVLVIQQECSKNAIHLMLKYSTTNLHFIVAERISERTH